MEKVLEQLEKLKDNIIYNKGGYDYNITWNERIRVFGESLEMIQNIKNLENVSTEEWYVLRKLGEELIKYGYQSPPDSNREWRIKKIYLLTQEIKKELETIPYIADDKIEIESINDWIKSLKIYKLNNTPTEFLLEDYYQTSYDLYQDIRKIVLTKNPPFYKKLYAKRVVDKLSSTDNQSILPKNLNFKKEDYELTELIRLIENNPDFHFGSGIKWTWGRQLINMQLEHSEWKNNLKILVKKAKKD